MQEICLKVTNPKNLNPRLMQYHIFNQEGGSLGSGSDNAWVVNDLNNTLLNIQACIHFEEGIFGIKPYDREAQIFLNDSFSPLPYSYETQINIGDYLKIGDLQIQIIAPQDLQQVQDLQDLGDLKPYDQSKYFKPHPQDIKQDLISLQEDLRLTEKSEDILELFEPTAQTSFQINDQNEINYANLQAFIQQKIKHLQTHLQPLEHLNPIHTKILNIQDLQSSIQHSPLLKNTEIANLLILSLLSKALHNPTLESIHPQYFQQTLLELLQEDNRQLLQETLLLILQSHS